MGVTIKLADVEKYEGDIRYAAYGALDAAGTLEIFHCLMALARPDQRATYRWSIAQLGPAVTMGRRGIRVDIEARGRLVRKLEGELIEVQDGLQCLPTVRELWDRIEVETGLCPSSGRKDGRHTWPRGETSTERQCTTCGAPRCRKGVFNPSSSDQVAHLLFDLVGIKAPNRTADEEALERVRRTTKSADLKALIDLILKARAIRKQLGFLNVKLSDEGRYHATFKVAGAWTGRWASSKDPFKVGDNAQNITEGLRHIFVADPGMEMFYADLKTAESLVVAYLSGDEGYIEAHKDDVHTLVTRLVWPDLAWTRDLKVDKALAKSTFPEWDNVEGHDYRFQGKRLQHGGNYGLTPWGMARFAHIPVAVARRAQDAYFTSFPSIKEWQKSIFVRVKNGRPLINPFERQISLMGRPWDDHTFKQGLSFLPQSTVGEVLNTGLWRMWRRHDPDLIQVLAQVHDAVLGQFPAKRREEALAAIREAMTVPFEVRDIYGKVRTCTIQVEIAVGHNWGKIGPDNPDGLEEVANESEI